MAQVLRGFEQAMPRGVRPSFWDAATVVGAVADGVCLEWGVFDHVSVETRIGEDYDYGVTRGKVMSEPAAQLAAPPSASACLTSNYTAFIDEFWSVTVSGAAEAALTVLTE